MRFKILTIYLFIASPATWSAEPSYPSHIVLGISETFSQQTLNTKISGSADTTPTAEQVSAYDTVTAVPGAFLKPKTPYFSVGSNKITNINLYGLNGFYVASRFTGSPTLSVTTNSDGTNSVTNFGDYLYYLASESSLAGWENNIPLLSGGGRILWVGDGASSGDVSNDEGMTLSSQTTALTFSGKTEAVNNFGILIAGNTAIEITATGNVASVSNSGTITAPVATQNAGTITGALNNIGTITGNIVNTGTIGGGIQNSGIITGVLTNTGTITGNIVNTGTISGGIFNSGTINGDITLGDAALTLASNNATVSGSITGSSASAIHIGTESDQITYIADNSATSGTVNVADGSSLSLADNIQWTAISSNADAITNSGNLILSNGSILNGNLTNTGMVSLSDESSTSSILNGSLVNNGAIVLNPTDTSAGNTLTINGDYNGIAGSSVSLGAVLSGDDSLTDRLVITGNTSGSSTLYVANENGSGAQTLEGIQLIEVDGTSGADFTLGNRVVAGAYDYSLSKGNTSGSDDSGWYLTSYLAPQGASDPDDDVRAIRPEAGSYVSNLQAANTMFSMNLHDRVGETQYIDPLTGETSSLWLRQSGGRNKSSLSDGQNKTAANRYVMQLGGDVIQLQGDAGKLNAGIMGGYADQNSKTRSSRTGYRSEGAVDGYSAGVYATWYQAPKAKSGLYVDTWLQYAWFDNEVKGQDLSPETYDSQGLMASAETGYDYQVTAWTSESGIQNSFWIQPHGQMIWSGVKADDHTESNGTKVTTTGQDNVQLRAGMKAYLNGKSAVNKDTGREFQPFIEANWIYNTHQYGASLGGTDDNVMGTRNAGELKAGLEGKISSGMSVWTNVAQVMGGKGYNDTQGTLGLRYQF